MQIATTANAKVKKLSALKKKLLLERWKNAGTDMPHVEASSSRCYLFISNYMSSSDLEDREELDDVLNDLKLLIAPFGTVLQIKFSEDKCLLKVTFEHIDEATNASKFLNEQVIGGMSLFSWVSTVKNNKWIQSSNTKLSSVPTSDPSIQLVLPRYEDNKLYKVFLYNLMFEDEVQGYSISNVNYQIEYGDDDDEMMETIDDIKQLCSNNSNEVINNIALHCHKLQSWKYKALKPKLNHSPIFFNGTALSSAASIDFNHLNKEVITVEICANNHNALLQLVSMFQSYATYRLEGLHSMWLQCQQSSPSVNKSGMVEDCYLDLSILNNDYAFGIKLRDFVDSSSGIQDLVDVDVGGAIPADIADEYFELLDDCITILEMHTSTSFQYDALHSSDGAVGDGVNNMRYKSLFFAKKCVNKTSALDAIIVFHSLKDAVHIMNLLQANQIMIAGGKLAVELVALPVQLVIPLPQAFLHSDSDRRIASSESIQLLSEPYYSLASSTKGSFYVLLFLLHASVDHHDSTRTVESKRSITRYLSTLVPASNRENNDHVLNHISSIMHYNDLETYHSATSLIVNSPSPSVIVSVTCSGYVSALELMVSMEGVVLGGNRVHARVIHEGDNQGYTEIVTDTTTAIASSDAALAVNSNNNQHKLKMKSLWQRELAESRYKQAMLYPKLPKHDKSHVPDVDKVVNGNTTMNVDTSSGLKQALIKKATPEIDAMIKQLVGILALMEDPARAGGGKKDVKGMTPIPPTPAVVPGSSRGSDGSSGDPYASNMLGKNPYSPSPLQSPSQSQVREPPYQSRMANYTTVPYQAPTGHANSWNGYEPSYSQSNTSYGRDGYYPSQSQAYSQGQPDRFQSQHGNGSPYNQSYATSSNSNQWNNVRPYGNQQYGNQQYPPLYDAPMYDNYAPPSAPYPSQYPAARYMNNQYNNGSNNHIREHVTVGAYSSSPYAPSAAHPMSTGFRMGAGNDVSKYSSGTGITYASTGWNNPSVKSPASQGSTASCDEFSPYSQTPAANSEPAGPKKLHVVLGLKQVTNHIIKNNATIADERKDMAKIEDEMKLVLLAPDTEQSVELDKQINRLISTCGGHKNGVASSVPIIYCLNRRALGKIVQTSLRQAAVGVVNLSLGKLVHQNMDLLYFQLSTWTATQIIQCILDVDILHTYVQFLYKKILLYIDN